VFRDRLISSLGATAFCRGLAAESTLPEVGKSHPAGPVRLALAVLAPHLAARAIALRGAFGNSVAVATKRGRTVWKVSV